MGAKNAWLPHRRDSGGAQLVCLAFAGGGSLEFFEWSRAQPALDLLAVELPGRAARSGEELLCDATLAAERIFEGIRSELRPGFAVYGHSVGGWLGLELVRLCERDGIPCAVLMVGACEAPNAMRLPSLTHLPDPLFLRELNKRHGGIPDEVLLEPELQSYFSPILRADLQLSDSFPNRVEPLVDCPIVAIYGDEDKSVTGARCQGWTAFSRAETTLVKVPGGHFHHKSDATKSAVFSNLQGESEHRRKA